ncbi:hypothetical protein ACNKHK_03215 [Shigella flexneri]
MIDSGYSGAAPPSQLTQLVFNNRLDAGLTISLQVVVVVLGLFSIKTALAALKRTNRLQRDAVRADAWEHIEGIVTQAKGAC